MKKMCLIVFALFSIIPLLAQEMAEHKDAKRRMFIDDFLARYEAAYEKKEIEYIENFFRIINWQLVQMLWDSRIIYR